MRLREALARRVSAIPLRVGLVVALVFLAAMVLLATGFAVTSALSRSLTARTDEQLYDAARSWAEPRQMRQIVTNDGATSWVPADMPDTAPGPRAFTDQPRRFYELRKGPEGQLYSGIPGTIAGTGATPDVAGHVTSVPTTVGSTNDSAVRPSGWACWSRIC